MTRTNRLGVVALAAGAAFMALLPIQCIPVNHRPFYQGPIEPPPEPDAPPVKPIETRYA